MNNIDDFFEKLEEPNQSVFLFLKNFISDYHPEIRVYFKWRLPYLYYKEKPLCYIWKEKVSNEPYLGFAKGHLMNHPKLISGKRTTIKILRVPSHQNIDVKTIAEILDEALQLY
ncbi:DUF1801 domain-containing protein [Wenyingzhuangia sp. IMCC45533]